MRYKQHKDSLRTKKYDSIPNRELNNYAINKTNKDEIANSLQRIIIKAISKTFHYEQHSGDFLMEMVSVGNESISNSINKYNNDKQDFAVYAYVNVLNDLRNYFTTYGSVVKSSIVKGKRQFASIKDMDGIDFSDKTEEDKGKPDYDFIYSILKQEKNPIKPHVWDIFCYTYGFYDDFPKTNVEAAEKFGFTSNNIRVINLRVRERMKNNEKIIKYLSSFL